MTEAAMLPPEDDLRNLWAIDSAERVVSVGECAPGVAYQCAGGCGGVLRLRAEESEHYRPHLYHVSGGCSSGGPGGVGRETLAHSVAKKLVAQRLRDWYAGRAPVPALAKRCTSCGNAALVKGWAASSQDALLEEGVGARRADVLVRGRRRPLAIEVVVSHPVTETKARELEDDGVDWIELKADDVLGDGMWVYTRGTLGRAAPCVVCECGRAASDADKHRLESRIEEGEAKARIDAARARASAAEASSSERVRHIMRSYDLHLDAVNELTERRRALERIIEEQVATIRECAALGSPLELHGSMLEEFRERRAVMLPSGAIVGAHGSADEGFRRRVYTWISAALGIAVLREERPWET